jgi:hypothetical protein
LGGAFFFALGVKGSGFIFRSARKTSSSLGGLDMGEYPEYLPAAYHDIGRAVFAWGLFDQAIIRQTWRFRDPGGQMAFVSGPIEHGFTKRWNEWCRIHQGSGPKAKGLSAFRDEVRELSNFRDNLCHNTTDIYEALGGNYCIEIYHKHLDWQGSFTRWVTKHAQRFWDRPPSPRPDEYLCYYSRDIEAFLIGVRRAYDQITDISEASIRERGYEPPSKLPFPV